MSRHADFQSVYTTRERSDYDELPRSNPECHNYVPERQNRSQAMTDAFHVRPGPLTAGVCECGKCWCVECDQHRRAQLVGVARLRRHFIVCPDCGNKRCPKAQHHDRTCTNSNATGQPGGG